MVNGIERPLDLLNNSKGKEILVHLKGDKQFVGTLLAFDIHINLVLDNINMETEQVMTNLKAVLEAAQMNFDNVMKATIFIKNMDDFQDINGVYGSYFDEAHAPARETVQVARLPKDVNVEISLIARK